MENRFSLSKHALSGALGASLVATLWIFHYLITTAQSTGFPSLPYTIPLWKYVVGSAYNLEFAQEALFVVVTRFLMGFGVSWLPITTIIAAVRAITYKPRKGFQDQGD